MIAALLLAAGRASRFGGNKLAAPLLGRPVIRWSADALAGVVDATYVVIPPQAEDVRAALASTDVRFVEHPGRDAGMGSSIAAGVAALPDDAEAVVIALGDQPLVSREVVTTVCARWRETGAPAVVPRYRDGRGHPVLFARRCFAALEALTGDHGARAVLESLGKALVVLPVDADIPADVDTPEALAKLARDA